MKDLGQLKYFLSIELARTESGLFLSQMKYVLDVLSGCGMLGCKSVSFPLEQNQKLALDNSDMYHDASQYRRLVGRLIYLTPLHDLTYAFLSMF